MKKRSIILITAIAVLFSLCLSLCGCAALLSSGGSSSSGSNNSDGNSQTSQNSQERPADDIGSKCLKYTLNAEGTGYIVDGISGSNYYTDEIVISPTYNGLPVVELATDCFNNWDIVSCSMPDTIVKIGANAFYKCDEMTSVKIPRDCETIDAYAFYCCKINSIAWGQSLKYIGEDAFYAAFNCSYVILPDGVEKIGKKAFGYNKVNFFIPNSVERMGATAFGDHYYSTSLYCESTQDKTNWDSSWHNNYQKVYYNASKEDIM